MDAMVRNHCEKEILEAFNCIFKTLKFDITVECEASAEGGFKETWRLFGINAPQIGILTDLAVGFLTYCSSQNKEYKSQQLKNIKLDNELKSHQVENIKLDNERKRRELKLEVDVKIEEGLTPDKIASDIIPKLDSDYLLSSRKSNLHKKWKAYEKIDRIGLQAFDEKNEPIDREQIVLRKNFRHFIHHSNTLPSTKDQNALITIISPVLMPDNDKWKGYYQSKKISFTMKDDAYKSAVYNKEQTFSNGVVLKCLLEKKVIISEKGTEGLHYEVLMVLQINNEPTALGKRLATQTVLDLN